jgi:hypothetical protein
MACSTCKLCDFAIFIASSLSVLVTGWTTQHLFTLCVFLFLMILLFIELNFILKSIPNIFMYCVP